ncbi:hypothetical protein MHYP_G00054850 [Metynnis hypsauchen]
MLIHDKWISSPSVDAELAGALVSCKVCSVSQPVVLSAQSADVITAPVQLSFASAAVTPQYPLPYGAVIQSIDKQPFQNSN